MVAYSLQYFTQLGIHRDETVIIALDVNPVLHWVNKAPPSDEAFRGVSNSWLIVLFYGFSDFHVVLMFQWLMTFMNHIYSAPTCDPNPPNEENMIIKLGRSMPWIWNLGARMFFVQTESIYTKSGARKTPCGNLAITFYTIQNIIYPYLPDVCQVWYKLTLGCCLVEMPPSV